MAEQSVAITIKCRNCLQLKIQGRHFIGKLLTVESGVAGWPKQGRNTELWGIPLVGGGGVREMASRPRHNQARRLLSDSFKIQSWIQQQKTATPFQNWFLDALCSERLQTLVGSALALVGPIVMVRSP